MICGDADLNFVCGVVDGDDACFVWDVVNFFVVCPDDGWFVREGGVSVLYHFEADDDGGAWDEVFACDCVVEVLFVEGDGVFDCE